MKRKMLEFEEEGFQGTLFGEDHMFDIPESQGFDILTEDRSQSKSPDETLTVEDVLNIYEDVTKVTAIERYLNILYRPFTCFLNTKCRYNLRNLRLCLPGSIYEPDKHMALVTTHRMPSGSVKIYANGNIYCQAFTRNTACRVLYNFSAALAELGGYNPSLGQPMFNLVNATFQLPFPLDLQTFNARHKDTTKYFPNEEPFLTYSIPTHKIKFAIFPEGFVYLMFCTGPYQVRLSISYILRILYRFRASGEQNQSDPELSQGDINYRLLWEKEFQRKDDFSIQWKVTPR